jgi:hypothetical protein
MKSSFSFFRCSSEEVLLVPLEPSFSVISSYFVASSITVLSEDWNVGFLVAREGSYSFHCSKTVVNDRKELKSVSELVF